MRIVPTTPLARPAAAPIDQLPSMIGYWDSSERNVFANKVYADARYAELHGVVPELAAAGLPLPEEVITPEACARALYELLR